MKKTIAELKREVCDAARRAHEEKLIEGTSGNVSVYDRDTDSLIITPSGYEYGIMEPEDVVVIDLNGNKKEGRLEPSSEWKMHAEIYRAHEHHKAVVHIHSPYASAFAVAGIEIPVILVEVMPCLKGSIEVSPYAPAGSIELGQNVAPYLKEKNACLMANHGAVACGPDLAAAYNNGVYLEGTAKVYHLALAVGTPATIA